MTTSVKVEAHCGTDTEVHIRIETERAEEYVTLQNGETWEGHVYDEKQITIRESKKETAPNPVLP